MDSILGIGRGEGLGKWVYPELTPYVRKVGANLERSQFLDQRRRLRRRTPKKLPPNCPSLKMSSVPSEPALGSDISLKRKTAEENQFKTRGSFRGKGQGKVIAILSGQTLNYYFCPSRAGRGFRTRTKGKRVSSNWGKGIKKWKGERRVFIGEHSHLQEERSLQAKVANPSNKPYLNEKRSGGGYFTIS